MGSAFASAVYREYKTCFPDEDAQMKDLVIPFHRMKIVDKKKPQQWLEEDKHTYEACEIVDVIHHAATDPSVRGILASFGHGSSLSETGWADLEEVRNAIKVFCESSQEGDPNLGDDAEQDAPKIEPKFAVAFADTFASNGDPGNKEYYLASGFRNIIMQSTGELNLFGLFSQHFFLRDTLSKLGIKMHVFKNGQYKNAPNLFTERSFTRSHRENEASILSGIQNDICEEIHQTRFGNCYDHSAWEALRKYGSFAGSAAQHLGFIDTMIPNFQAGGGMSFKDYSNQIEAKKLAKQRRQLWKDRMTRLLSCIGVDRSQTAEEMRSKEQIALLHVDGSIGNSAMVDIVNSIRKIGRDPYTKCVVVRVSSPGGNVDSCETILQELKALQLPYVCSFGNMSTSGGYYIASGADRIFASKKSITGSIGVFAVRMDLTGLAKKHGIKVDHVATGPLSGMYSPFHPMTRQMKKMYADSVERSYSQFKNVVAEGRSMSMADVEAIAQGRLWTGLQAKENGLVDEIGGLHHAIDYARCKFTAGEAEVVKWPKEMTVLEMLMENENDPRQLKSTLYSWAFGAITTISKASPRTASSLDRELGHQILKLASSARMPKMLYYASDENAAIRCLSGDIEENDQEAIPLLPPHFWE